MNSLGHERHTIRAIRALPSFLCVFVVTISLIFFTPSAYVAIDPLPEQQSPSLHLSPNADKILKQTSPDLVASSQAVSKTRSNEKAPLPSGTDELKDHQAKIFDFKGDVKIMRRGAKEEIAPAKDWVIEEGDKIVTGKESYVEIAYDPYFLNIARIGAETEAEFRAIEPTDVFISEGGVFSMLGGLNPGTTYEVSTPTAVAGVRGTRFEVTYEKGVFECETFEGRVEVFPFDQVGDIVADRFDRVDAMTRVSFEGGSFDDRVKEKIDEKQAGAAETLQYIEGVKERFTDYQTVGEKIVHEAKEAWVEDREGERAGQGTEEGARLESDRPKEVDGHQESEYWEAYRTLSGKGGGEGVSWEEAKAVYKEVTGEELDSRDFDRSQALDREDRLERNAAHVGRHLEDQVEDQIKEQVEKHLAQIQERMTQRLGNDFAADAQRGLDRMVERQMQAAFPQELGRVLEARFESYMAAQLEEAAERVSEHLEKKVETIQEELEHTGGERERSVEHTERDIERDSIDD